MDQTLIIIIVMRCLWRSQKCIKDFTAASFAMIVYGKSTFWASVSSDAARNCNTECGHYAKIAS